jgi:hypothetical protein
MIFTDEFYRCKTTKRGNIQKLKCKMKTTKGRNYRKKT